MRNPVQSSERCQKTDLVNSLRLQSQPHMENVIVIMHMTEFWNTVPHNFNSLLQTRKP